MKLSSPHAAHGCWRVALRAGAWIETAEYKKTLSGKAPSPSVRGRGLKQQPPPPGLGDPCVALRAGAWIETNTDLTLPAI